MMSTMIHAAGGATHEVLNQPPPLVDYNAFEADPALREALIREGGEWGLDRVRDFGGAIASAEALAHARRAQRNIPVLRTHDRYGHLFPEVDTGAAAKLDVVRTLGLGGRKGKESHV